MIVTLFNVEFFERKGLEEMSATNRLKIAKETQARSGRCSAQVLTREEFVRQSNDEELFLDNYWLFIDDINLFQVGDKVRWYDPDEEARDLSRIYTIDKIYVEDGEEYDEDTIFLISDGNSEAEVTANELELAIKYIEEVEKAPQRNIVYANGKALHLVFGKSRAEWEQVYADNNPDLWDVPFEELVDGTLDVDEDVWYWFIDGRCFETDEKV